MLNFLLQFSLLFVLWSCEEKLTKLNPLRPVSNAVEQGGNPTIVLQGQNPYIMTRGSSYVEPGYQARDYLAKDLTSQVVVTKSLNTNAEGIYIVRYNVTDDKGRKAEEALRVVRVMAPVDLGSPPTITLMGDNPFTLPQGSTYEEPGFKAFDHTSKDITSKVVVTKFINSNVIGDYVVRYNVTDDSGRNATEVTRIVKVAEPLNTSNGEVKAVTYPNQGQSPYEYYEYLPKGYDQNPTKTYPLVIFLHGLGEQGGVNFSNGQRSGAALSNVIKHGPLKRVKEGVHFPAIIVHPQSPVWWNSGNVKKFLDVMKSKFRVDSKRIYVTGLSMGGGGTWDFARAYPQEIAAIVPVCGATSISIKDQAKPLLNLPIWAFHARGDGTVSVNNSYSFLNNIFQSWTGKNETVTTYYDTKSSSTKTVAIENKQVWIVYEGINPGTSQDKLLTIYTHSNHDSWTETYKNQKMWDWLFSKSRP